MSDAPAARRWPRPSPFVLMLLGMGVVILGLLLLIILRPEPDFTPAPPVKTMSSRETVAYVEKADREAGPRRKDRQP